MLYVLAYAAVIAGTALVLWAVVVLMQWATTSRLPGRMQSRLDKWHAARCPPPEPMPPVLHQLELARLAREIRRVRDANQPGLATRVRACTAAYDDVLVRCAQDLGIDVPRSALPLSDRERFEVETELMAAGMQW